MALKCSKGMTMPSPIRPGRIRNNSTRMPGGFSALFFLLTAVAGALGCSRWSVALKYWPSLNYAQYGEWLTCARSCHRLYRNSCVHPNLAEDRSVRDMDEGASSIGSWQNIGGRWASITSSFRLPCTSDSPNSRHNVIRASTCRQNRSIQKHPTWVLAVHHYHSNTQNVIHCHPKLGTSFSALLCLGCDVWEEGNGMFSILS